MARKEYGRILTLSALILGLAGCEDANQPFQPKEPEHALIYAFPMDGMVDLPLGSKALFAFSSQVDQQAVSAGCSAGDPGGPPEGAFCITGPDGLVDTSAHTSLVNQGRTIQFDMNALAPGTRYQVWLRPSAAPDAVNLEEDGEALLAFHTRQNKPIAGTQPDVLAVNQEDPAAFTDGADAEPQFPFMDFSPIRITFSEPLEQDTVRAGESVQLLAVDAEESTTPVDFELHANRHYMTLQPDSDLTPGTRYEVRLSDSIRDLNNQSLAATTFVFEPNSSKKNPDDANPPIRQKLETWPVKGDPGYPRPSQLSGLPLNRFALDNTALGRNSADTIATTLEAWLANPPDYPDATPMVMRGGQSLKLTGINPAKLGGEVHTDLDTGVITGTFITNVTGYLTPNPYRPDGFQPDDERAPLYVYMDFDMAMQTEDDRGNASLNQNLMHARAIGIATVDDGNLVLEAFRTLAFNVLGGATTISADFSLSARSNPDASLDTSNVEAPTVTGSLPRNNDTGVDPDKNILLTLNEPVSRQGLDQTQLLNMDNGGVSEPVEIKRQGTSLVIAPESGTLEPATQYRLQLSPQITDNHLFNPRTITFTADDATDGSGEITFTTADYARTASDGDVPPIALGVYPGVGCALTDTDIAEGKAGRCMGGQSGDRLYNAFQYELGRPIEITFSQPMNADSMEAGEINAAGDACLDGAACIARNNGGSWETIDTPLVVRNRAAELHLPHGALEAGQDYRLVINGSAPTFRSHAMLGNQPLNTTPLSDALTSGNDNIVIDFTAVAPFETVYATVRTRPYTDTNGNGHQDATETAETTNAASVIIDGWSGLITNAEFSDPEKNKIFVSGALPMAFLPKVPLDLSLPNLGLEADGPNEWCLPEPDAQGETFCMQTEGDFMIPVEVNPQHVLGTSVELDATAGFGDFDLLTLTLPTGPVMLRIKPREQAPMLGYVVNRPGEAKPYFLVKLDAWLDAPNLELFGLDELGLVSHSLNSAEVTAYLGGPVSFLEDGRITLEAANVNAVSKTLSLYLGSDDTASEAGSVNLLLEPGTFAIQVMNLPAKARQNAENNQ